MSTSVASGSPTTRRGTICRSQSLENAGVEMAVHIDNNNTLKKSATVLSTSKLGNQAPKKMKVIHNTSSSSHEAAPIMDKLLAKLNEQQAAINKQHEALKMPEDDIAYTRTVDYISSSSSIPVTPATEASAFHSTAPMTSCQTTREDNTQPSADVVRRLQLELQEAKGRIARMDQELAQTRITNHTIEQAIGTVSEVDFPLTQTSDAIEHRVNSLQQTTNASVRHPYGRDSSWTGQDDSRSDASDALSAGGFNRARAVWGSNGRQQYTAYPNVIQDFQQPQSGGPWTARGLGQQFSDPSLAYGSHLAGFRGDHLVPELESGVGIQGDRRGNNRAVRFGNRSAGSFPFVGGNNSFDNINSSQNAFNGGGGLTGGVTGPIMGGIMTYQPQPIGTPLSPFAPEFTSSGVTWKNNTVATEGQTYLPTTEPLNYRRLLDRTVNCNWKYIVDKIVCNNDQQASIFLQQKLKVGTNEQKYDIVEAIVAQAYALMVNRFGNFLVQRCFEHGTPAQVIKIAEAIRGNTLTLSTDAFGCHVIQKAFDSVPEDYKAIMVHELLRRIPETVIHRYACHVWQKLFELRWVDSPPQVMKHVNESLRGRWHEVALGETGSLVVQNIFENCLEEDKRPCIEEVLAKINVVAQGQFGNWCIQHICEHGAPADRSRAIDHVIRYASDYSMDQFASKVVEKCLKIGGVDFLSRYLDRVCEGRLDRPRIPLIDIASDQYGNYLIQYILTHSNPQHREIVACHIRKHMVSLRGSKFGSRVGMLCTNPAIATRPGPGVGPAIGTRMPQQNSRFNGAYR